jgi:beta-galactosidase
MMRSTPPVVTGAVLLVLGLLTAASSARESRRLDADWRFTLGDPEGADAPGFDDSAWRLLSVPHDWAFEADYHPEAAQTDRGGYKPGGVGWYRKSFALPEAGRGGRVRIEVDAVYMNSEVWINGKRLGRRPYGYISFGYDLTPYLEPGRNVIAVRVDNSLEPSARWYHGCGIYAHVRLVATESLHVSPDGVFVTTPTVGDGKAEVRVETEVANAGIAAGTADLETVVLDPSGRRIAVGREAVALASGATGTVRQTFSVTDPLRWDTATPHLYKTVSRVSVNGRLIDEVTTRFGIRTIRWEAETGFWLNGKNVKLRGVCDHLEAGPVGAASPDELIRWKVQLLKEMGCNAVRVAHNPQVPAFYDVCDELGMLVMDEIFDGWMKKAAEDYGKQAFAEWWERDLRAWLKRDRNHPSIIVWSLGNETRGDVAADLVRVCHDLDPSRLTTSGHSGSQSMDVFGINGHSEKKHFFEKAPDKPFISTEAPHTWQVRGYYRSKTWYRDGFPNKRQDPFVCPDLTEEEIFTYDWAPPGGLRKRKQIFNSSYDNAMVRITARKNWELMRDLPWHGGHFRWTGFDYLGEAGYVHGGWPFRAFMGGALDLAGFEKDLFYFYQSQWTDRPMVHILPHWTHPKMKAGTLVPVWVYSNCEEVELRLNGKSLGRDRPGTKWDKMQCEWLVPWKPGKLEAVGYRGGKEVTRGAQTTAGAPAKLKIDVEGAACPIVTVTQTDDNGVMNPYAENRIHYHVDGPARILSLESGNPVNTENNFGTKSRAAFFGLARAFLRTTDEAGDISVVAGAILGEKQLMTSDRVHIDVRCVAVRGKAGNRKLAVRYSTDGTDTLSPYTGPFSVRPGTMVKAVVMDVGQVLFSMAERFGPDEGIHWRSGDAVAPTAGGGDQAEDAAFEGAVVSTAGKGYHGKGFLDFKHNKGAFVQWYQENDGSAGEATLTIRYSGKAQGKKGRGMKLSVNGRDIHRPLFFPNTSDWGTDWRTLEAKIKIRSGANTIRLTTIENGGPYIDGIEVR